MSFIYAVKKLIILDNLGNFHFYIKCAKALLELKMSKINSNGKCKKFLMFCKLTVKLVLGCNQRVMDRQSKWIERTFSFCVCQCFYMYVFVLAATLLNIIILVLMMVTVNTLFFIINFYFN